MIQRVQTLFLLLTTLLPVLFLNGSILKFLNKSGTEIALKFNGIWQSDVTGSWILINNQIPLPVTIISIALLSLAAIFFYKKRKTQMKLTIVLIILSIIFLALIAYDIIMISNRYQVDNIVTVKMFIPLLIPILSIMAYRGIKKDEELVKSYERLR
jgi:hypothetical protein